MFEGEGEGGEGEAEVGIESAAVDETPAAEEPAKEEPAAEAKQAEAPKATPFERLSQVLETRGMKELVGLDADVEVTQEWLLQQPLEVRQRLASIMKAAISQRPDVEAAEKLRGEAEARAAAARAHELKSRAAVGKLATGAAAKAELDRLTQLASGPPVDPDIDPAKYIERESAKAAAQAMRSFMDALAADANEAQAAAEAEAARSAAQAYVDQHKEDLRQEMENLDGEVVRTFDVVRDLVREHGLTIERAHAMARRMRGSGTTRPTNVGPSHVNGDGPTEPPAGLTLQQQNAWFEANPAAVTRYLAKRGRTVSAR